MTTADTAIELTLLEWNVKDGGINGDRGDRRLQRLEFPKPHPIAAENLDARRARVDRPPFTDQVEQSCHCHSDAMSLSACVVAIPRPVAERTAA